VGKFTMRSGASIAFDQYQGQARHDDACDRVGVAGVRSAELLLGEDHSRRGLDCLLQQVLPTSGRVNALCGCSVSSKAP
jgi:hypothetical protein